MSLLDVVNKKLALETILAQLFIAASMVYFLFLRKKYPKVEAWIGKWALLLAFLTALGCTAGSLFYSNVAGFAPCELCWFQRIFMYPLVIILGLALIKNDRRIVDYALAVSGIGWLISLYQNYIYYTQGGLPGICQVGGSGVSCVVRYVFEFGYVTIPVMALTGFTLVITFLIFAKIYDVSFAKNI